MRCDPDKIESLEGGIFDGPTRTKEINLADEGNLEKVVFIGETLTKEESEKHWLLLKEYRDFFAWSYKDLKGIPEEAVVHTIPIRADAILITQRPYITNLKIA